ncbi:MAG: BolA/IbaG family iron-sulfur metabolism protein [Pseudobdellovibrionaceae bacterium]
MPMTATEIEDLIRQHLPDAEVVVRDLAGDGDHYEAEVRSAAFKGKSRVQQHQMVFAALGAKMGGELHALSVKTFDILHCKV